MTEQGQSLTRTKQQTTGTHNKRWISNDYSFQLESVHWYIMTKL